MFSPSYTLARRPKQNYRKMASVSLEYSTRACYIR